MENSADSFVVVACLGLLVSLACFFLLRRRGRQSLLGMHSNMARFQQLDGGGVFDARSFRLRVLAETLAEYFPVIHVNDLPQCTVCIQPIRPHEPCRILQCHHPFHADCILEWWGHEPRRDLLCPTCRHEQQWDSHPTFQGSSDPALRQTGNEMHHSIGMHLGTEMV